MNEEFNVEEYDRLQRENNYLGMANYLEAYGKNVTEPQKQLFIRGQVKALREQAAINSKILEQSDNVDDINKYTFYQRVLSNGINRNEAIDKQYLDYWDNAGTNKAKSFAVQFNRDDYDNFLNNLGATNETLFDNFNINSSSKDGKYVVAFDKSNPNFVEITNALVNTYNTVRDKIYEESGGFFGRLFSAPSRDFGSYFSGRSSYKTLSEQAFDAMPITAIDKDGRKINVLPQQDEAPYKSFNRMFDLYNDAKNTYDTFLSNAENKEQLYESYISPFMGAAHADLKKLADRGLLSRTDYEGWVKQAKANYDAKLYMTSLSNKEVWEMDTDDDGNEVYKKVVENALRSGIHNYLTNAIDNDRIHYAAGTMGGVNGVFVTIGVKPDSKGKIDSAGPYDMPRSYFIKDLWEDNSETALRDDTNSYTLTEYNKHLRYGHDYITDRGGTIKGFDTNNFLYTDSDGITYPIDKNEVLNIIHEDIIFNQGIALAYETQANGFTKNNVEKFEYVLQDGFLRALKNIYGYQDGDSRLLQKFGDLWFPLLNMFNLQDIIHPKTNEVEQ